MNWQELRRRIEEAESHPDATKILRRIFREAHELFLDGNLSRMSESMAYHHYFRSAAMDGHPLDQLPRFARDEAVRFDAGCVDGLDGCILYEKERFYGNDGKQWIPQRWAWHHAGNPDPPPPWYSVKPMCGTKKCVNVKHLVVVRRDFKFKEEETQNRLRVMVLQMGRVPTSEEWDKRGGRPRRESIRARWGSWDAFVESCGYKTSRYENRWRGPRTELEEALESLSEYIRTTGDKTKEGYRKSGRKPSSTFFWRHFGSWEGAVNRACELL